MERLASFKSLEKVKQITKATLVLKRGAKGNSVIDRETKLPENIERLHLYEGLKIEVLNVLGAGDAFISGFLKGWLDDQDHEKCSLYGNASGALVVSRHGCSPATPSWEELDFYLKNRERIRRIDRDPDLNFLHKVTNRSRKWGELFVLAFDHQTRLEKLVKEENQNEKSAYY